MKTVFTDKKILFCIEASHSRGLGHLFRSLNLARKLNGLGAECRFLLNNNEKASSIIQAEGFAFSFLTVGSPDLVIFDKLNTRLDEVSEVTKFKIPYVTFDDRGEGATHAELNFGGLIFDDIKKMKGKKILTGTGYLLLDPLVEKFKRKRTELKKIVVSLGGSDTYNVALKISKFVKELSFDISFICGPAFESRNQLTEILKGTRHQVVGPVPSLIEEFSRFDLALTGGGVTPFEAIGQGLPCLVVASEEFEVPVGEHIQNKGFGAFLGYHKELTEQIFQQKLDWARNHLELISDTCLSGNVTTGTDNIIKELSNVIQ